MRNLQENDSADLFPALAKCSPSVSGLDLSGNSALIGADYDGLRVAILGSRSPDRLGVELVRGIAGGIAGAGGVIVSGLSTGVETIAHESALAVGGLTVAVLPCGLGEIYPSKNETLATDIVSAGGLLCSEYERDAKALAWYAPIRTRIISALADVLIVPQGTLKGNARIGADLALAMGRRVFAVPGAVDNELSALPNDLIKSGRADVILSADDALEMFETLKAVR